MQSGRLSVPGTGGHRELFGTGLALRWAWPHPPSAGGSHNMPSVLVSAPLGAQLVLGNLKVDHQSCFCTLSTGRPLGTTCCEHVCYWRLLETFSSELLTKQQAPSPLRDKHQRHRRREGAAPCWDRPSEPRQALQADDDGRMAHYFLHFLVSLLLTTCKMICQLSKELCATFVPAQTAIYLDVLQKKIQRKIKYRIISCLDRICAVG